MEVDNNKSSNNPQLLNANLPYPTSEAESYLSDIKKGLVLSTLSGDYAPRGLFWVKQLLA